MDRRHFARAAAGLALTAAGPLAAQPRGRLVFGTNWFAQAEHGGYYQALALEFYAKAGLDVELRMGGPQVNVLQLLLAGKVDLAMGDDLQILSAVEQGLPLVTIGATFQRDPVALIAHPGVTRIEDLREHTIFVGQASESTYWPWLKARYGFSDARKKRYTFSVQPFLADRRSATQGYVTSEPFTIEQAGVKPVVFLLGDLGYPPYAQTVVATRDGLAKRADAMQRFLRASAEGWVSYLADPAPAHRLIRKANPEMSEALLDFGVRKLRAYRLVTGGDAEKQGVLTITAERWQRTRDFMVEAGLLRKDTDHRRAFDTSLIDKVRVLPGR